MPRTLQDQPYQCVAAAAAAATAGDHGRKLHELPWLYLDSVGHEYGPVPGWTMREWLTLGRFPVGNELRVRLPEWERHLPLHQLYPDLSVAFVLPPAWPDVYSDGMLPSDERDADQPHLVSSMPPWATAAQVRGNFHGRIGVGQNGAGSKGYGAVTAMDFSGVASHAVDFGGKESGSRLRTNGGGLLGFSTPSSLFQLQMAVNELPSTLELREPPSSPPPPKPQYVLERLMQEEQLLPPPPPQPSQRQLRELLSQPQEGPLLWEDDSHLPLSLVSSVPPAGLARQRNV